MTQHDTEKFAKKLLGESEIEAVLQRLDRLTQEEGRMTVAQTLEVVHGLMNTVKVVMNGKQSFLSWCMFVQLRSCLGRRESIDGRNLEGIRYTFASFELGIAKADEGEDAMQEMAGEINKIRRSLFLRSATWVESTKASCRRSIEREVPKLALPS
jgi:hypothetical protein